MGVKLDEELANSKDGIYTFRIHRGIYHSIGSLFPNVNKAPKFMQLYIYDMEYEMDNRLIVMPELRDHGWHPGIKQNITEKKVTTKQYYVYKLHICQNFSSLLHYGGKLFQQYVVDNYVKIECERLNYLKFNQDKLRRELYQDLHDSYQSGVTKASEV
ncbi:15935_t:CDS:2 [Dentiscutata erythropus]|uniref:15935_t:CDS:1 n=1 Tax=Dentiscutata erythropus TaxID=1348616 RepID=A0A9N8W087_9GLOM|nr:15935_t:CDS:2 [Dentiscutata erythropus]